MIITCTNCNKKFDINSNLIPDEGRLLECSSCNYQWFFKKEKEENISKSSLEEIKKDININEKIPYTSKKITKPKTDIKRVSKNIKPIIKNIENNQNQNLPFKSKANKKKKKLKIQNLIIVFIISFVAFIIILDTFKYPIGIVIPNIEFLLNNLYESLKDIRLFFNDLI
tara:strand:+ start:10939 stop:11445 length:507 start_codon:yes stop_codon:yes gene_type:complete